MGKNFDSWNDLKKQIDQEGKNKFYHPRDIWWCKLGLNVGFEQDGKDLEFQRPIVVLKGFGDVCLVVPLTSSSRQHIHRIDVGIIKGKSAKAIVSQMRVVDTKRFVEKVGVLSKENFEKILKSTRRFF